MGSEASVVVTLAALTAEGGAEFQFIPRIAAVLVPCGCLLQRSLCAPEAQDFLSRQSSVRASQIVPQSCQAQSTQKCAVSPVHSGSVRAGAALHRVCQA